MPVYNPRADWLREALESVVQQWCGAWELICVDDASSEAHVREILAEYAVRDVRIRPLYLEENGGISYATNRGIAAARGDYIAFMDHDDVLEPEAVWRMLDAAEHSPSLIYSDEAVTGQSTSIIRHIVARPAFSYDYYLSTPYFVHFVAVWRELAVAVAGLNETMKISADVDFVLRVLEKSATVAHVPAVLYRWRMHESSTGHARMAEVTKATLGALNGHLQRLGVRAVASEGLAFNGYRIDYEDDPSSTLIIIPTKNRFDLLRRAISSILATTSRENVDIMVIDHDSEEKALKDYLRSNDIIQTISYSGPFNFAKMNNAAVSVAARHYKYLVFCNNDIEALEPGWLEHMRGLCARSDVGVVGATLLYPDETIQHSGVVMGLLPLADHAHKFKPYMRTETKRNVGYNYSLIAIREYSAVTAACMMMRREVFDAVGGFDEEFAVGFNDTDLCLRVGTAGYKVLVDPYAVLYHHESATRARTAQIDHPGDAARLRRRWSSLLQSGDPFYSPLLSLQPPEDHGNARPDTPYRGARVRSVVLPRVDALRWSERCVANINAPGWGGETARSG
jgi:GT2 family glycosyltransferase